MPFKFLPKLSKTSDLDVKLVILYIKIPDTEHKTTVPEKVDMYLMVYVERLELSTLLFNCHSQFNSVLK